MKNLTTILLTLTLTMLACDDQPDCSGNYYDEKTDLCWQVSPTTTPLTLLEAEKYCDSLDGGHVWFMPTIDELRTLLRVPGDNGMCTNNIPSGSCEITDETTDPEFDTGCGWCAPITPDSCFWPSALQGDCNDYYWSNSLHYEGEPGVAYSWAINYWYAKIDDPATGEINPHLVRCVK